MYKGILVSGETPQKLTVKLFIRLWSQAKPGCLSTPDVAVNKQLDLGATWGISNFKQQYQLLFIPKVDLILAKSQFQTSSHPRDKYRTGPV